MVLPARCCCQDYCGPCWFMTSPCPEWTHLKGRYKTHSSADGWMCPKVSAVLHCSAKGARYSCHWSQLQKSLKWQKCARSYYCETVKKLQNCGSQKARARNYNKNSMEVSMQERPPLAGAEGSQTDRQIGEETRQTRAVTLRKQSR